MNDPFEILRGVNATFNEYLEPGDDPAADELLKQILGGARVVSLSERRSRRRRRAAGVFGVVVLVGAGTAAAAAIFSSSPTRVSEVVCYSEPSVEPEVQVELSSTPEVSPTDACAEVWRTGPIAFGEAPPLTQCVTSSGIIAVLPGTDEACGFAGLAVKETESVKSEGADPATVRELTAALRKGFEGECFTLDEATHLVEGAIAEASLAGWAIEVGTPLDEVRRCAAPAVDEIRQVVVLVGVPG